MFKISLKVLTGIDLLIDFILNARRSSEVKYIQEDII